MSVIDNLAVGGDETGEITNDSHSPLNEGATGIKGAKRKDKMKYKRVNYLKILDKIISNNYIDDKLT